MTMNLVSLDLQLISDKFWDCVVRLLWEGNNIYIYTYIHTKANTSIKKSCVLRNTVVLKIEVSLSEFKSCLLAALRSTLPQVWTPKHEEAWTWLWDNVVRSVNQYTVTWQPRALCSWFFLLNKLSAPKDRVYRCLPVYPYHLRHLDGELALISFQNHVLGPAPRNVPSLMSTRCRKPMAVSPLENSGRSRRTSARSWFADDSSVNLGER